jgi:hypothetical protein
MCNLGFSLAKKLQKILNVLGWLRLTLSRQTLNILMSVCCVHWANPKYTHFLFVFFFLLDTDTEYAHVICSVKVRIF